MTSHLAIRVRDFHPNEADVLLGIFRSAVRMVARRDYTQEQVIAWAPDHIDDGEWAARCAAKQTFVAEMDNLPVGFTDLEPDGHLDMMFVHAQYQGWGVASALLFHVESAARRLGLKQIFTEASITARPFFERRGFQLIAQQVVLIRGVEFINYRMSKPLDHQVGTATEVPIL